MAARCGRMATAADARQVGHCQHDAATQMCNRCARGGTWRPPGPRSDSYDECRAGQASRLTQATSPGRTGRPRCQARDVLAPLPACQGQAGAPRHIWHHQHRHIMINPAYELATDSPCAVADAPRLDADLAAHEIRVVVRACHLCGEGARACLAATLGAAMVTLGRWRGQCAHRGSRLGRRGGVLLLRRRLGARLWPTARTGRRRSRRWRRWTAAGSRGRG